MNNKQKKPLKKYRVTMRYIFKDCDYVVEAYDKEDALERAKQLREAEWEAAIKEVEYWEAVPLPHERDTE